MIHYFLIPLHIFAQLFLLIFSAFGWAHWIWRLPKMRQFSGGRLFWVFLVVAGFCVGIVVLQNLFYLGWHLRFTSWLAFGGAVLGNSGWILAGRRDRTLAASILQGVWQAGVVCFVVFLLQSVPLFFHGPSNYYGNAHTDQVNYVLVSQFIADHPNAFHATRADPDLEPYSDIAMGFLGQRMGQSVGLGYLSVVSWGNTKSAYGVFSILALDFGAVAVFVLLRTMAIPAGVAMLAGCWWALLPAITKMDLDGFLSQTWHAWTLPLSAALFDLHRRRLSALCFVFQSIYFAFVMSFYPETFIINVAFSTCLLVFASGAPLTRRVAATVVPPVCELLEVGWYLTLFINTLIVQYHNAAGHAEALEILVPLSGTLLGWSTTFFASGFASPLAERATIALSLGMLAIMAAGLLCVRDTLDLPCRSRRRASQPELGPGSQPVFRGWFRAVAGLSSL